MDPASLFLTIIIAILAIAPLVNNYTVKSFLSITKDKIMADLVPPLIFALSFFVLLNTVREIGRVYTDSSFVVLIIIGFLGIVVELFVNVFMSANIARNFLK